VFNSTSCSSIATAIIGPIGLVGQLVLLIPNVPIIDGRNLPLTKPQPKLKLLLNFQTFQTNSRQANNLRSRLLTVGCNKYRLHLIPLIIPVDTRL
jgi:hypothetical protein